MNRCHVHIILQNVNGFIVSELIMGHDRPQALYVKDEENKN
jgi:hypothetical protein